MAHRIYIYNIDSASGENFPTYLGEWNYEIPPLLLPLFGGNLRSKGTELYADREQGILLLRQLYTLLADTYQLHYKKAFYEPVETMFTFLNALPFDTFQISGSDVFNMNEEKHTVQAREWVVQLKEHLSSFHTAVNKQQLDPLSPFIKSFGYTSFLEILQTDWINYGLGYWNDEAYRNDHVEIYEEQGLKGLKDFKGNVIMQPQYQEIYEFSYQAAVIQKDEKYGYLSTKGYEFIKPVFDDAFDVFEIFTIDPQHPEAENMELVGIVEMAAKSGMVNIKTAELVIPTIYDELDHIFANYFNAKKDEQYIMINAQNEQVIRETSVTPFEFENSDLYYIKEAGKAKRKYFSVCGGIYLGEYLEDVLQTLPNHYFYAKSNKKQTKIEVLKSDGSVLVTEIDQIITLSDYATFAFRKEKHWFLYNTRTGAYILTDTLIQKVNIEYLSGNFQDIYILQTNEGKGIFNAIQNIWIINPKPDHLKIEHLRDQLISIQLNNGMYYWDGLNKKQSPLYDYVSEAINLDTNILFLYKDKALFCLTKDQKIREIKPEEMGQLHHYRYNLRGTDLQYFNQFYMQWKDDLGPDYLQYYDDESLFNLGLEYAKENQIDKAIHCYALGATRNHPAMMAELAMIYTNMEDPAHANLALGLELYQKSAILGEKTAWNNLGYHFQNGLGIEQNIDNALAAYTKAGELGNGLGWENLGVLYYYGELVEKDHDKALDFFLKAQKKHYYNADKLTDIYFAQQQYKKVLPLLKKDYDETFSSIYYGIMYTEGLGGLRVNLKKAISYYEKALEYAVYPTAAQQLLYYYRKESDFADDTLFQKWLNYARENEIELDLELLGIAEEPEEAKGSFFKNLFRKKK